MSLKLPKTMGVFKVRVDFTFFGSRILTNQIIRRDINPYKAQMKVVSINLFVFFRLFWLFSAVRSNINAVHELTEIVRTSLGPNGRLKLVVNHLGKQALTNDSATILKEIDVVHPAAKLLVMASQQQEAEVTSLSELGLLVAWWCNKPGCGFRRRIIDLGWIFTDNGTSSSWYHRRIRARKGPRA